MNYTKGKMKITQNDKGDYDVTVHDEKLNRNYAIANFGSYDNALLFVAAPLLYEALKEMLTANKNDFYTVVGKVDGHDVNAIGMARHNARKALMKAEGK